MKHLLNNISEEEKNSILEQHKGGMEILNENFNKMVNKKLGHVELFEQQSNMSDGKECEVPRDCALTIKNSNLVDIFIKNKKAIFDNLGIKPMTNLTRFKNYLSRQIDSKVKSLVNVD